MKRILFFLLLISATAFGQTPTNNQIGVIGSNLTIRPLTGFFKFAYVGGKLVIVPAAGDTVGVVTKNNIYPNPSWLGSVALEKVTGLQTALDLKAPLASPTFTGTVSGITKAMVGLSNVENTSDANKPVSTATQTALDLKASASQVATNTANIASNTAAIATKADTANVGRYTTTPTYKGYWDGTLMTANRNVVMPDKTGQMALTNDLMVLNKQGLIDFILSLYSFNQSPAGRLVGIAWYGDSVSPHVSNEIIKGLGSSYVLTGLCYPGGLNSAMTVATSGVFPYNPNITKRSDQTVTNGLQSVSSITRSGSTATLTVSAAHSLTVGQSITIAGATQSEYNGVFTVVSVPTTTTATFTVSGTPATPATGTITLYGGLYDFTYLPGGDHTEMADGAILTVDTGQNTGYSHYRTYLATGPGMGSALVELRNFDTDALITSEIIPLSAGSIGATKVTLNTAGTGVKHKVRITATGKVVVLRVFGMQDALGGIVPVRFGQGGTTFTQNNSSNSTIFNYLMTDLNVSLVMIQAKEEGMPGSLTGLASRMNNFPLVSKLIIASLPDVGQTEAAMILDSKRYHDFSNQNGYAFMDGRAIIGSYARLVARGIQGDGVHPPVEANQIVANAFLGETFNLLSMEKSIARRGIDQRYGTSTITNVFRQVSVSRPDDPTLKVDVITGEGGANPTKATLGNIHRIVFGPPATSSTISLETFGTNGINVQSQDGVSKLIRARNFEMVGSNNSTMTGGLGIGGGSAAGSNDRLEVNGNISMVGTSSRLKITAGTNAGAGIATLVAGTVTVATTAMSLNSVVILTVQGAPGAQVSVSAKTSTSFTITSTDGADTRSVGYFIINLL